MEFREYLNESTGDLRVGDTVKEVEPMGQLPPGADLEVIDIRIERGKIRVGVISKGGDKRHAVYDNPKNFKKV